MSERICGGIKTSESEFQIVPATSTHPAAQLTAACGPNASADAARWADQSRTAPTTVDVYRHMRALGKGGADGLSDLGELTTTLRQYDAKGFTVVRPNAGESALSFMLRMAGQAAVVWETQNGQVLRDYLTGLGMDANNLERHILCSWGYDDGTAPSTMPQTAGRTLPPGFWMSDGDSDTQNVNPPRIGGTRYHWPINERLVYYPLDVVKKANPIDALAVLPRVAIPGGTNVATNNIPSGWRDDGKTLIAPNGVPVVRGFRTYVLAQNWQPNNWPLKPEMAVAQIEPGNAAMGKGARQDFRMTSLGCQQHADGSWGNPYVIYVGQDILALETQLAAALQHVSQLEAQVAELEKQQPPAPVPAPQPDSDPKASEALAALVELAKALKLVAM